MDKPFWIAVKEHDFELPAGHSLQALTEELIDYLGSTDPELRDTIGLEAFSHWVDQGLYTPAELRALITRLSANLHQGLGETESDSVFRRSFSTLWLAVILEQDIKKPELTKDEIAAILEAALAYFPAEQDLRGLVPVKGWAHAIAHTADLFCALAHSPHADANMHLRVLDAIARKLISTTSSVFLYGEDARLARVAIIVFIHETLTMDQVKEWLAQLSVGWNGAWKDEGRTRSYFNGRNFLRAIHWRIPLLKVDKVPQKEAILGLIEDTLEKAEPWK